jgi:PKD repeat protein
MHKPRWTMTLGLLSLLLITALPGAAGYQTDEGLPQAQTPSQEVYTFLPLVTRSPLKADFTGTPTSDPVPVTVFFTNRSVGYYTSSSWDFGDGMMSTETHPIHFYPTPGVYTVTLTVSGPQESDTLTRTHYITVEQPLPMVPNGSFEDEDWTDIELGPDYGYLINQEPAEWTLQWAWPGEPIFGSGDIATGVPECVHKYDTQLPPNERPGGPDALILDGQLVYKVFHNGASFGVSLTQTITGLSPGAVARLRVPVQVHLHGDPDPWGAESGSWVNGYGQWVNGEIMGDRRWYVHEHNFVVPGDGEITVEVRFKSKWSLPKDFFIDAVQLELVDVHK